MPLFFFMSGVFFRPAAPFGTVPVSSTASTLFNTRIEAISRWSSALVMVSESSTEWRSAPLALLACALASTTCTITSTPSIALQAAAVEPRVEAVIAQSPFADLESIAHERAPFVATRPEVDAALAEGSVAVW